MATMMVASAPAPELNARVEALEAKHHGCSTSSSTSNVVVVVDDQMRRARSAVEDAGCYSSVWKWVPPSYYDWSLPQRANFLQAPNIDYLCKSLLLENKKVVSTSSEMDRTNPQYILVVLQYAATLDVKKLCTAIRSMRKNVHERLDESQFDVRVASTEDNDRLTGYSHNSVTPFGLLQPEKILIVLSQEVVPLKRFWMGGGHVDLKLSVTVSDFCKSLNPVIADISQPRTGHAAGGVAAGGGGGNVGVPGDQVTGGNAAATGTTGGSLAIGASGNLTSNQLGGGAGNAPPTNEKTPSSKEKKHKKDKKKKKHRSGSKKEKRSTGTPGTPSSSSSSSASDESKTVGDGYVVYVDNDQTPDDHSAITTKKKKKKKDKKKKKSKKSKGSKDGASAVVEESTTSSKSRSKEDHSSEDIHSNSNGDAAASSPESAQKATTDVPAAATSDIAKSSNDDHAISVPTLSTDNETDEPSPGKTHRFMQAPSSAPSLPKTSSTSSGAHIDSDLQAIMARRRQMAETTTTESVAANSTTPSAVTRIKSPKKELKAVGMSSDLQAIMARRRRMAEGDNSGDEKD